MTEIKAEYRNAERNAGCRCCDKSIKKGDPMVSWYSHWNRGMHIHLCTNCAKEIGRMVEYKERVTQNDAT